MSSSLREQLRALGRADDPQRGQRGADGGGDAGRGEQERAAGDPQEVDHLVRAGDEAAAGRERLAEGAHAQVDVGLDAEQLATRPRRARRARPRRAPRRPSAARRRPCTARRSAAAARCRPPSRRRRRRPRARRRRPRTARWSIFSSFSSRLCLNGRSLAREIRQPSRIEAWSAESTITVSPGARIVPSVPDVGLVAGREDDRLLGPHPLRQLALEVQVQVERAVEQPRAGQPGAVAVEGVTGRLPDPRVGGEAEVVVGAEHDPLGALHLHHGPGRALQAAEVGQQIRLAGRAELLRALVPAHLGEDVDGSRHW